MLGVGYSTLRKMMKDGEIKFVRLGGRVLIPRSEIERVTTIATLQGATYQNNVTIPAP
jgi:excisionase family DNA binding protein